MRVSSSWNASPAQVDNLNSLVLHLVREDRAGEPELSCLNAASTAPRGMLSFVSGLFSAHWLCEWPFCRSLSF